MPRKPRELEPEGTYHVISRGNNRARIFHSTRFFETYLRLLREARRRYHIALFHYVLMSNHVHLIFRTHPDHALSSVMKFINESYAREYKKMHMHTGHVWTNRFKSYLIDDDGYLLTCGSYIELNPVRAGMVADPADYRWSSYRHNALGEPQKEITTSIALDLLSGSAHERRREYRNIVRMWQGRK